MKKISRCSYGDVHFISTKVTGFMLSYKLNDKNQWPQDNHRAFNMIFSNHSKTGFRKLIN